MESHAEHKAATTMRATSGHQALRRQLRIVLAALLIVLFLPVPAAADIALTPHSAEYKIKISVLGGRLNTELRTTPTGYIATHTVTPTGMSRMFARGSIEESSEFNTARDGVRPKSYSSIDTISRDKGKASIWFDWDAGEARGTVNGEEVVSIMDGLAHDRVSIQYELMHDLLNDMPGARYTMFEVDRLRPIEIRNVGTRTVKVPAGKFEVVGIQHQAQGSKRRTTLWCAPDLDYLPVLIEQHRLDKLKVRAALTRYRPAAAARTLSQRP